MKINIYGKTKEEIIFELVISLNQGNAHYTDERVRIAKIQYDQMVEQGIIKESEV